MCIRDSPNGNTKEETSSETSRFSSQHSIVIGSVAALELVEKATNCAGAILEKKFFMDVVVKVLINKG